MKKQEKAVVRISTSASEYSSDMCENYYMTKEQYSLAKSLEAVIFREYPDTDIKVKMVEEKKCVEIKEIDSWSCYIASNGDKIKPESMIVAPGYLFNFCFILHSVAELDALRLLLGFVPCTFGECTFFNGHGGRNVTSHLINQDCVGLKSIVDKDEKCCMYFDIKNKCKLYINDNQKKVLHDNGLARYFSFQNELEPLDKEHFEKYFFERDISGADSTKVPTRIVTFISKSDVPSLAIKVQTEEELLLMMAVEEHLSSFYKISRTIPKEENKTPKEKEKFYYACICDNHHLNGGTPWFKISENQKVFIEKNPTLVINIRVEPTSFVEDNPWLSDNQREKRKQARDISQADGSISECHLSNLITGLNSRVSANSADERALLFEYLCYLPRHYTLMEKRYYDIDVDRAHVIEDNEKEKYYFSILDHQTPYYLQLTEKQKDFVKVLQDAKIQWWVSETPISNGCAAQVTLPKVKDTELYDVLNSSLDYYKLFAKGQTVFVDVTHLNMKDEIFTIEIPSYQEMSLLHLLMSRVRMMEFEFYSPESKVETETKSKTVNAVYNLDFYIGNGHWKTYALTTKQKSIIDLIDPEGKNFSHLFRMSEKGRELPLGHHFVCGAYPELKARIPEMKLKPILPETFNIHYKMTSFVLEVEVKDMEEYNLIQFLFNLSWGDFYPSLFFNGKNTNDSYGILNMVYGLDVGNGVLEEYSLPQEQEDIFEDINNLLSRIPKSKQMLPLSGDTISAGGFLPYLKQFTKLYKVRLCSNSSNHEVEIFIGSQLQQNALDAALAINPEISIKKYIPVS